MSTEVKDQRAATGAAATTADEPVRNADAPPLAEDTATPSRQDKPRGCASRPRIS